IGLSMVIVVGDTEGITSIQCKVIRLARMDQRSVVREESAAGRQCIDVGRVGIADDLAVVAVFHDHDDDMIVLRYRHAILPSGHEYMRRIPIGMALWVC